MFLKIWFFLQIRPSVKDQPELYSQIYTPHPVVVPGGRFRELYYWWVTDETCLCVICLSESPGSLRRSHRGEIAAGTWLCRVPTQGAARRQWREPLSAQQGLLLGHQRAPAVGDDTDGLRDDSKLPLPHQQVSRGAPFIFHSVREESSLCAFCMFMFSGLS